MGIQSPLVGGCQAKRFFFLFGKPNRKGWRYGDNHGYDNTQGDYKPRAVN